MFIIPSLIVGLMGLVLGGSIVGFFMSGLIGVLVGPIVALFGFWFLPFIWIITLLEGYQVTNHRTSLRRFLIQGAVIGFVTFSWIGSGNLAHAESLFSESARLGMGILIGGPVCGVLVNLALHRWIGCSAANGADRRQRRLCMATRAARQHDESLP